MSIWRRFAYRTVRLGLAAGLLMVWIQDHASRELRNERESLPLFNLQSEARRLRNEGSMMEARQALELALAESADGGVRVSLIRDLEDLIACQHSLSYKVAEFAGGVVRGTGGSVESLAGAIMADFLVVGDVRDLLIQGGRWIADEDVDRWIVALSGLGLATTLQPQFDAGTAVCKWARRTGAIGDRLAAALKRLGGQAVAARSARPLKPVLADMEILVRSASPGSAMRILRCVENPSDLRRAAAFVEGHADGAYALAQGPDIALKALRDGGAHAAETIRAAARRGPAGMDWLRRTNLRLTRPHPGLGLLKGLYKGTIPRGVLAALARLDRYGLWIAPALAAWVYFELVGLLGLWRLKQRAPANVPRPNSTGFRSTAAGMSA